MLSSRMESKTITTNILISSILNNEGKEHETIKALLKNFLTPDTNMAIKENLNLSSNYGYTTPVKPPTISYMTDRMKSINEAKEAFLNSTVSAPETMKRNQEYPKKDNANLHYAQIVVTTENEDSRSTGGGDCEGKATCFNKNQLKPKPTEVFKKRIEQQQRKVSFKIKNASNSHRRPPLATKTTMTIASNKVSELTKKFNNLVHESQKGSVNSSKLVKTIENLQAVTRRTGSNSSTPSSTFSSSPNIKIVLRQRRGSKKRSHRKRCSSVDSIDKLVISDSSSNKIQIIRSKSDGNRTPKTTKKRLNYQDSSSQPSGSDSVDGTPVKSKSNKSIDTEASLTNVVKNVVKKFECEIIAQCNAGTLPRRHPNESKMNANITKEKPKVPEKKSTLVLTKNVVVKDGVPKIKTIRPLNEIPNLNVNTDSPKNLSKKEPLYDKKKYKTSYIHSEKMPLHVVEIIQEDDNEVLNKKEEVNLQKTTITITSSPDSEVIRSSTENEKPLYQDVASQITPNDSFLWRRKSSTTIYSDSDRSVSDSPYGLFSITLLNDDTTNSPVIYEKPDNLKGIESKEETATNNESNSDFETNLVEAYNNEILRSFTTKPKEEQEIENDYEPLELLNKPNEQTITVPVKKIDRNSKINCPLPDIPREEKADDSKPSKENIYQCLLEMRSHPEGDESSLHSYELCDSQLEERTRGDGDSDHGYEYCKSSIKPYCHTSSAGIHIAEDYRPYSKMNDKNYFISKSVSGASTVSYEKIGSERIYEKIPSRPPKSKDSSPTSYSNRHSFISSDYTYNDGENIYDTIKHGDGTSLSHCYESIPNSPSLVKLRHNFKKQLTSAVQKRLSFDTVSNISQSTLSSEQKTNSIYGQRSVVSYGPTAAPGSDTSGSDRSDEWVDVSDDENNGEHKVVIVRERSRGRKSPISWSQKVRHQWQKSPKQKSGDYKDGESSDSGHLYESLEPPPPPPADDIDSFDSDSDCELPADKTVEAPPPPARLPAPPSAGPYTLTKIASAAQRKMRQLKRNLTKRYSVAVDGKSFTKSTQSNGTEDMAKTIYANYDKADLHVYSNVAYPDRPVLKVDTMAKSNGFKEEKKIYGEVLPLPEKPTTPTSDGKKENGTLSRKAYFSFKSRFRRASSMAVDINADVPSALKITNSTFYLTDSMDGDSGFSNCSENGAGAGVGGVGVGAAGGGRSLGGSSPCLAPLERPQQPPPPPPVDRNALNEELKRLLPTLSRKEKGMRTRTSWYAECGADDAHSLRQSTTSWYTSSGLYQAGSSASSSGASSGSHPASPLPTSLFTHEPLYQFYNAAKLESVCGGGDSDSETYSVGAASASETGAVEAREGAGQGGRPSAMALAAPRGPARTLWCEVPEVRNSTVLSSLAPAQKRLQEAKFELLTSEASYLNSLNVLEAHFISHPAFRDPAVLPPDARDMLFSAILPVRRCSLQLMNALEKCWQENILLQGICDVVRRHARQHFQVYVDYCQQQALMVRTLQALRERPVFATALRRLESHPACQALSLHSFLLLPMQRVTRLPLLLDAVLRHLHADDSERAGCMDALATLNKLVSECNEAARSTERVEEMFRLARAIQFPPHLRAPPDLGPACARRDRRPVRWLVRSGEMTQLVWKNDELKLTFGKKFHKVPLHVFLFNDHLVITKKKSGESYVAVEHCARSLVEVCAGGGVAGGLAGGATGGTHKHTLLLTLLENHEGRTQEMLMSCPSETDASRWLEALGAGGAGTEAEGEAVYAGWDCPQVAALYAHTPAQPDELALAEGDVVNVTRKTSEGWYYGERIRDGETGWFPGAYTVEIASAHVRARNLRQRYRLLALSGTYLGQKRRPTS